MKLTRNRLTRFLPATRLPLLTALIWAGLLVGLSAWAAVETKLAIYPKRTTTPAAAPPSVTPVATAISMHPATKTATLANGLLPANMLAMAINYTIAPGATLDIAPISSIIPASPAGMDRMEVTFASVPGVSHGTMYRVSLISAFVWGSGAPNAFMPGSPNNRIFGGEGFRYVNDGTGAGTSETIPVRFRDATGFNFLDTTIVITIDATLVPPTITTQPNPLIRIPSGSTATMSVVATDNGHPPLSYQWYGPQAFAPDTSSPIAGATGTSYMTPALNVVQQNHYWVRVTSPGGVADSIGVTVQVETPTTVTASNAATIYGSANHNINLNSTATAQGVNPLNQGAVQYTCFPLSIISVQSGTIANGIAPPTAVTIPGLSAVGVYPFTAFFQGPAGFADATDSSKTITINPAPTTTTAASTVTSASTSSQSVTLNATVTSAFGPVGEGTVTFTVKRGASTVGSPVTSGTVTNNNASATYTLPANTVAGVLTIAAVYNPKNPAPNYLTSSDSTHTLTVAPVITANTATIPQSATSLTINGFGFDSTPGNNSVAFNNGTGTVTAATYNQLTVTGLSNLVAGVLNAKVTTNGVMSQTVQVAIVLAPPTISKSFTPGTIVTGQTSTLNIVVGNPAANLANLSGIAFTDTLQAGLTAPNLSTPLCGGTVAVSGNVVTLTGGNIAPNNTCTIPITVTGAAASASAYTNTISSVTSSNGGANNTPATANITVNKANTTASITGAMLTTATVVGEPYTVSAAVTVNAPGSATPTAPGGTITISDGSQTCTITLPAISCSLTSTSPGAPKNITATYNGDSNFNASPASTAALHSVNKANTTTTITADTPDSSTPGQSVTVNFTVVAVAPGSGTPTGNVTVTDSASAATCTGTVAAGTCNITLAAAGSRTLTATYVGNSSFNTSTSAGELHTVASPPTVTKSFTPTQIKVGETSVMTFSVANPNAALSLNNISFSDTFPAGIEVDNPVVATNTCGGSFSPPLAGGATSFSYSGGSRAGGASPCTISIQVKATVAGLKNNTTGAISSTETGTGATSNTATLTVVGAPTLAKAFTPATVVFGQTSSLGFTITNSNPTLALSGIVFTDTLPAGLTVATSGPTATCGGMLTTTAPNTINFTGGTLAAGNPNPTTCNFSVPVSYAQAGTFNNTSGVISATESGAGTTSNLATLTVNPATTTTTLGASVNPSVAGQSVTFTATVAAVAPGSGLPSGTVIFVIDGVSQPPVALVAGQAMLTISALSVGSHPISANYAGSTNFNSSSNVPFSQVVNKANTTLTSITDAPDPSVTGQAYTVGFTLNVTSPGAGTPTGTVTVSDGAGGTCTATLPTTSCSLTSILAGNKTVTITYNGDANFNTSSNTAGHAVNQADTLTTITADNPDPSVVGQSVTVNYTVAANSPGSGTPTGNVVITVSGGAETCTGTVAGGFCSLPLTTLGNRTITATYQGNTNYNGSASAGAPHTVSKADTTTTIVSDNPDSSAVVQNVTAVFTVVATAPGSGTPTGNVTVSDGVNSCTGTVAAGSCVLALTTPGSRTLTATYAGETNFNGSSDTESHTVVAPPSIAKAFAPNTISVNGTTTLTFTITNPAANTLTLTGVGFTDTFPNNPNLVVATPLTTTNTCGGTLTNDASGVLAANNTGIKLSGGTVGIGGSCTVSVNVTPKAQGPFNNVSGNVTSTNGGNGNTAAHTLSTNNPPTIIVSPVLRIEGAAAANATVATVNDVEDAENTLLLKVNGGTSATVNGVTVSNLAVNAAGVVTADVASPCGATTAIFTVRVTDSGGLFAEAFLPVTVTSQPPPALRINDVTLAEGSPSGTTAFTFTVALTPAHLCQAVTVNYATANGSALAGSDYTATSNSLSFAPGETVKTITVNVSKDKEVEPDETFFVNLSNPVNATLADAQGLGTITNDDFPPFTATMGDPFVCSGVGSSLLVTATLTNPNSTPQAATFNVTLPSQLTIIPNTCTANVGTCTTTPPNQVAWMGNLGAGQTVTIQYQAQVADGTPLGTLITINSTGSVNGVPTSTSASGTVSCPNNGPNSPVVNDQKPGSLLVFPYYKHDAQNKVDTRLTITNIGKLPINVHFLFLDGATCQEFDQFVCFTPNASITWKASEFDPQNKGYLIAYVTDNQGQPLAYNGLIGNAFVTDGEYVGNYGAESFASPQALGTTIGAVSTPGLSWTIPLDGIALDMAPTAFAVELQSPVDTINQKLVLAGLRGDAYAGTLGGVTQIGAGLVYNGHEALRSFSPFISGQCLVEKIIDSTTPRVAGTMASLMPKGEVGTLRFSVTAATGLLLTSNKNALSGIRTLHKVQVGISSLIVPLLTPDCQYWRPQP